MTIKKEQTSEESVSVHYLLPLLVVDVVDGHAALDVPDGEARTVGEDGEAARLEGLDLRRDRRLYVWCDAMSGVC